MRPHESIPRGAFLGAGLLGALAIGWLAVPGVAQEAPAYVGSDTCRRCHLAQHRSWQQTAHAKAFELLQPGVRPDVKTRVNLDPEQDYRANEFCLRCHTVGYLQPGGFVSLQETPELAGVGCESCHGPGGAYVDLKADKDHAFTDVAAAGMIYPVSETECRRCHGEETPFNPAVSEEYALPFDDDTFGESGTHVHRALTRRHGPLPEGVRFQPDYDGGN